MQALSIALTSLAIKLDIMLTEDADKELVNRTARNIACAGFLVVFQGLISTYGKEHVSCLWLFFIYLLILTVDAV